MTDILTDDRRCNAETETEGSHTVSVRADNQIVSVRVLISVHSIWQYVNLKGKGNYFNFTHLMI